MDAFPVCLIISLVLPLPALQINPCVDNSLLDNPKRSMAYEMEATDFPIQDYNTIVTGNWYRFQFYGTNIQIPELAAGNKVEQNYCGTDIPIWISGLNSHPTGFDETSASVCCSYDYKTCDWSATIGILRCEDPTEGSYYVYRLTRPETVRIAYCAGDALPCDAGKVYNPSLKECVDHHPVMPSFPTLSGPVIHEVNEGFDSDYFTFSCHVQYNPQTSNDNAMFKVTFIFDGRTDDTEDPSKHILRLPVYHTNSTHTEVVLRDSYLRGRLGKWLGCMVQSYWSHTPGSLSEILNATNPYWVGVQTQGDLPLVLSDYKGKQEFVFVPTVPVLGPKNSVWYPTHFPIVVKTESLRTQVCSFLVGLQHWDGFTGTPELFLVEKNRVAVTVTSDGHWLSTTTSVTFEPMMSDVPSMNIFQIWTDYVVSPVPVTIDMKPASTCYAYWGFYMKSFDGRHSCCNDLGEFYLWKSDSTRVFEVQIAVWIEDIYKGLAVCGVAVREGNHVLGITMCNGQKGSNGYPLQLIEYLRSDDPRKGVIIRKTSYQYDILMPSGAKVEVEVRYNYWLNVRAYPIGEDRSVSSGMCGNYNDDYRDDPDMFNSCQDYSVPVSESLFARPAKCKDYEVALAPPCECIDGESREIRCDVDQHSTLSSTKYTCSGNEGRATNNGQYAASEIESYDDNLMDDADIFYEVPRVIADPPREELWPTPENHITEQQAQDVCDGTLRQSVVFDICEQMVDVSLMVDNCKNDIALADGLAVANDYRTVMESMCKVQMESNITITSLEPEEKEKEMEGLREFEGNICPNHCSGQGSCAEGICDCFEGFTNDDCSLLKDQQPTISYIRNGGLCDRRQRPCQTARMFVEDIDESSRVVCRVIGEDVFGSTETRSETEHVVNASIITSMEISCQLPLSPVVPDTPTEIQNEIAAVRYHVAISNNGLDFSSEASMTVYDSVCIGCNGTNDCLEKITACHIDGHCSNHGRTNPDNVCEFCDSNVRHSWSQRLDVDKPLLALGNNTEVLKYEGELQLLDLPVSNTEGLSVSCQLITPKAGITLSTSCLLTWDAEANQNETVLIQLTNECGESSNWAIRLLVYASSWSSWGVWSACSRECDLGVQTRNRTCLSSVECLNGDVDDLEACNLEDCQPVPAEDQEGVILYFNGQDIPEVLTAIDVLFNSIAEATNAFCSESARACCETVNIIVGSNIGSINIAKSDNCSIGSGYPLTGGSAGKLKILLRITKSIMNQQCIDIISRSSGQDEEIYFDSSLLTASCLSSQSDIEEAIGLSIVAIEDGGTPIMTSNKPPGATTGDTTVTTFTAFPTTPTTPKAASTTRATTGETTVTTSTAFPTTATTPKIASTTRATTGDTTVTPSSSSRTTSTVPQVASTTRKIEETDQGLNTGVIVAISVVGVISLVSLGALIGLIIFLFRKWRVAESVGSQLIHDERSKSSATTTSDSDNKGFPPVHYY